MSQCLLSFPAFPEAHGNRKLMLLIVLSKFSWHFTVADISKTWVIQNLDNTLISYVRNCLDLPISATISHLTLSKSKFGLNLLLPSTKFLQRQTVLWENTSSGSNIQYDIYQITKQVLKAVRSANIQRIQHELSSQGTILSAVFKHSLPRLTSTWSLFQGNLPKKIFNFTVRYMSNTLATRNNLLLWKLLQTSDCSSAYSKNYYYMLLLDARYILKRVGILGATILF